MVFEFIAKHETGTFVCEEQKLLHHVADKLKQVVAETGPHHKISKHELQK